MIPEEQLHYWNASNYFTDERSIFYKLTPAWTLIVWVIITGSLIIGWIAKYHIYRHIFKTKLSEQVRCICFLNI
jgi:hypothetical protein